MKIISVTINVVTDSGAEFTLVETKPEPQGDNPCFMLQQFLTANKKLMVQGMKQIETLYPGQYLPENK